MPYTAQPADLVSPLKPIKPGPLALRHSQGPKTGMGMQSVLLGWALVLLWASTAWADVLVQPDFDAKKVPEASVLCCGGAGG